MKKARKLDDLKNEYSQLLMMYRWSSKFLSKLNVIDIKVDYLKDCIGFDENEDIVWKPK